MRLFMSSKADLQNVPIPYKGTFPLSTTEGSFFPPGINFLYCEFLLLSFRLYRGMMCVHILRFF